MLDRAALAAFNHLLAQSAWARGRLAPFAGRQARVTMPPWRVDFSVTMDGWVAAPSGDGRSFDVEIVLPADAPLRLPQGFGPLMASARISGAADFAEALGFVLGRLRWDFEEDLSRLLGDVAAHRLAAAFGALVQWQRQAADNLVQNVAEYLRFEQPMLVGAAEAAQFGAGVAQLDEAVARLEQRLARIGRGQA